MLDEVLEVDSLSYSAFVWQQFNDSRTRSNTDSMIVIASSSENTCN